MRRILLFALMLLLAACATIPTGDYVAYRGVVSSDMTPVVTLLYEGYHVVLIESGVPTQEVTALPTIPPSGTKCELRIFDTNLRNNHAGTATIVAVIEDVSYVDGISFWYSSTNVEWARVTWRGLTGWIQVSENVFYDPLGPCIDLPADFELEPLPTIAPTRLPAPTPIVECFAIVNADTTLNFRSGPGSQYTIIGRLTGGQRLLYLEQTNDYAHLRMIPEYTPGWAHTDWLTFEPIGCEQ